MGIELSQRSVHGQCSRFFVSLAVALMFFAVGADATDEWRAADKPVSLANGSVAFEYAGDLISAITVTPVADGTVCIYGDEMPLAADATVSFAAPGKLIVSNAVTCAGNMTVSGCGGLTRGWHDGLASTFTTAAELKASLMPTNFTTLFTDMDLDEWEPYAYYGAKTENKANAAISTSDITLNPNSSPDTFLEWIERQEVDGVKCLKAELAFHGSSVYNVYTIEMRQAGADVEGRLVGFERDTSHPHAGKKAEEARLDPENALTARAILHPDATGKSGFCITQLMMRRLVPPSTLCIEGRLTVPSANRVVIAEDARMMGRIGMATAAAGSSETETSPNFEANGMLTLFDGAEIGGDLRGKITGAGTFEIAGIHSRTNESVSRAGQLTPEEAADITMDFWDNKYIVNNGDASIASCRQMLDLTNADAFVLGTLNPSPRSHAKLYHLKWKNLDVSTGKRLVGQFQGVQSTGLSNLCCYVEFLQDPNPPYADLFARLVSAYMVPVSSGYPVGIDFDTLPSGAATEVATGRNSVNTQGVALRDIKLYFSTPRSGYLFAPKGENADNAMSGTPRFVVKGSVVRDQHCILACSNALPASGCVEVKDGGWLHLKAEGTSRNGYSGGAADIIVRKGGHLWLYQREMIGDSQRLRLDGGELRVGVDVKSSVSGPYLEYLTMRDGAVIEGHDFKIGNRVRLSYINVCGSAPSTINAQIIAQAGSTAAGFTNEWRVADVTGSAAADLVINGDIVPFGSDATKYTNIVIRKLGPGTVRVNGQFRHYAPVRVCGGTLEFGVDDAANGREFILDGGTLSAADGTASTCAALVVDKGGGSIRVSEGSVLAFGDSRDASWDGAITLLADGDELPAGALRFGTSSRGLTSAQVAKMRFNGKRVHLRADGSVTSQPMGSSVIFR